MALNENWVQELLAYQTTLEPPQFTTTSAETSGSDSGSIGRAWVDGTIVVYDLDDIPAWLAEVLSSRDDDGNTDRDQPRVTEEALRA